MKLLALTLSLLCVGCTKTVDLKEYNDRTLSKVIYLNVPDAGQTGKEIHKGGKK